MLKVFVPATRGWYRSWTNAGAAQPDHFGAGQRRARPVCARCCKVALGTDREPVYHNGSLRRSNSRTIPRPIGTAKIERSNRDAEGGHDHATPCRPADPAGRDDPVDTGSVKNDGPVPFRNQPGVLSPNPRNFRNCSDSMTYTIHCWHGRPICKRTAAGTGPS